MAHDNVAAQDSGEAVFTELTVHQPFLRKKTGQTQVHISIAANANILSLQMAVFIIQSLTFRTSWLRTKTQ